MTIGLPVTPRNTTGYLILPAATPALPLVMTSSQLCRRAVGVDVVAIGQGLQVADERHA